MSGSASVGPTLGPSSLLPRTSDSVSPSTAPASTNGSHPVSATGATHDSWREEFDAPAASALTREEADNEVALNMESLDVHPSTNRAKSEFSNDSEEAIVAVGQDEQGRPVFDLSLSDSDDVGPWDMLVDSDDWFSLRSGSLSERPSIILADLG